MTRWICKTCGVQFAERETPPEGCPICLDQRQYVGYQGQQWTTLEEMQRGEYHNQFREYEP
jgi:rubredoxin